MKLLDIRELDIPDVKIVRFGRFKDHRGFFTEHFRKSDLLESEDIPSLKNKDFVQANHSYSRKGVVRGLHFQWNPYMGKLVRTLSGHMVDLVLDVRKNSPTYGKIIAYDMPADRDRDYDEWIWVPPGFAHGNYFREDTEIEYLCTGEYSPGCEAGISPLASDLDWSLCDSELKELFEREKEYFIISDKDREALTLKEWSEDERSSNFIYDDLKSKKLS